MWPTDKKKKPGAAPWKVNNETTQRTPWQHQWWFYWHIGRSHSCKPCGQKLYNLFRCIISNQKFYEPRESLSNSPSVAQLQKAPPDETARQWISHLWKKKRHGKAEAGRWNDWWIKNLKLEGKLWRNGRRRAPFALSRFGEHLAAPADLFNGG